MEQVARKLKLETPHRGKMEKSPSGRAAGTAPVAAGEAQRSKVAWGEDEVINRSSPNSGVTETTTESTQNRSDTQGEATQKLKQLVHSLQLDIQSLQWQGSAPSDKPRRADKKKKPVERMKMIKT